MILFYCTDLTSDKPVLDGEEFTHCIRVLRRKIGDKVHITDGKGSQAVAEIVDVTKSQAILKTYDILTKPSPKRAIHLLISPPKSRARWEWVLEKSVEIGVRSIIPVMTERSERKKVNIDRAAKVMRSAALQSLQFYHPTISPLRPLDECLNKLKTPSDKILCHYAPSNVFLADTNLEHPECYVLIGPEGDFTEEECNKAQSSGFIQTNISPHRLRTETAAIVSLSQCLTIQGLR